MKEWQPIETAPKDGVVIRVRGGTLHRDGVECEISSLPLEAVELAKWDKYEKRFHHPDDVFYFFSPKEWAPLLEPPR